jgi:hypothetical protein
MRYYDHRIGVVSDVRSAQVGVSGCHGLGCLGALGVSDCASILAEARRLQGLAKTRSKKEHRAAAAAAAAAAMQRYQQCVASNAAAAAPITPTPVVPIPLTPSVSPEPIPYVPMVGGGGGGSSSYPEMVPMPDGSGDAVMSGGYCVNEQGVQVACPTSATGANSGFFTPSGQPIPMGTGQVTQTNQFTSTGQPVFYNAANGQTFYYGPTGQPVYFTQAVQPTVSTVTQQPQLYTDPTTGRQFYYDPATGQQVYTTPAAGTGLQLASQALTPVPYAQMPTNGGGGDGELVPYGEGASAFAQPSAMPQPTMQTGMVPQAAAYGQPAAQQYTINEKDLIAQNGPTEYTDKWGTIKVLGLVFPAAKARAAAAAAQTVSTSGQGVLPGGEMKVEDFTAQYVLEGGQW